MDSLGEKNASSSDDYNSVFKFRFWRSLTLIVHGVFLHHLFQALNLGGGGGSHGCCVCCGAVLLLAILISAATLGVYNLTARAVCYMQDGYILVALHTVFTVLIHDIIAQELKGNPKVLVLLPLQIVCFTCYLRSVTRGDPATTLSLLFFGSMRNAVFLYNKDGISIASVYYFAAVVLGSFAKNTDRGFRAPNAGSFDRFLDILG